jgi:hypothetical protein
MSNGPSPDNEQVLTRAVSAGVYDDRDETLDGEDWTDCRPGRLLVIERGSAMFGA